MSVPDTARFGGYRRLSRGTVVLLVVAVVVAVVVTLVTVHLLRRDATHCAHWDVVFNGYGSASCTEDVLSLRPAVATASDETHAGLATSRTVAVTEGEVTTVRATVTTRDQLREGQEPNPWEVAWLLWSYEANDHFYALVLKPNGWEVSKQDPAHPGSQRFLASGTSPTYAVGTPHEVVLSVDTTQPDAMTVTVIVNGVELATVSDTDSPYRSGKVAAYTEDAAIDVLVEPVREAAPDSTASSNREDA